MSNGLKRAILIHGGPVSGEIEQHISVDRAEELTDISRWTWRQKAYKGVIASTKVGRRLLIPISEIERVLAAGRRPARAGDAA